MKRVGQALKGPLARPELLRMAKARRIMNRWPEIVGDALAGRSRPDRYANGVVWVAVSGSAWTQELRMRSETILRRMSDLAGDPTLFVNIRFGVRPLPPLDPDTSSSPSPRSVPEHASSSNLSIREMVERRLANWPLNKGP